jgi:hypothetical protein
VYLAFGLIFLYKAYEEYSSERNPYMFLAIGIVAIAMFFFRRHFHNKQINRKNK